MHWRDHGGGKILLPPLLGSIKVKTFQPIQPSRLGKLDLRKSQLGLTRTGISFGWNLGEDIFMGEPIFSLFQERPIVRVSRRGLTRLCDLDAQFGVFRDMLDAIDSVPSHLDALPDLVREFLSTMFNVAFSNTKAPRTGMSDTQNNTIMHLMASLALNGRVCRSRFGEDFGEDFGEEFDCCHSAMHPIARMNCATPLSPLWCEHYGPVPTCTNLRMSLDIEMMLFSQMLSGLVPDNLYSLVDKKGDLRQQQQGVLIQEINWDKEMLRVFTAYDFGGRYPNISVPPSGVRAGKPVDDRVAAVAEHLSSQDQLHCAQPSWCIYMLAPKQSKNAVVYRQMRSETVKQLRETEGQLGLLCVVSHECVFFFSVSFHSCRFCCTADCRFWMDTEVSLGCKRHQSRHHRCAARRSDSRTCPNLPGLKLSCRPWNRPRNRPRRNHCDDLHDANPPWGRGCRKEPRHRKTLCLSRKTRGANATQGTRARQCRRTSCSRIP